MMNIRQIKCDLIQLKDKDGGVELTSSNDKSTH